MRSRNGERRRGERTFLFSVCVVYRAPLSQRRRRRHLPFFLPWLSYLTALEEKRKKFVPPLSSSSQLSPSSISALPLLFYFHSGFLPLSVDGGGGEEGNFSRGGCEISVIITPHPLLIETIWRLPTTKQSSSCPFFPRPRRRRRFVFIS